ncbi:hypothetical protein LCGC14_2191260 [marine sediment metagenome]|uniref:Uncharacterized protein n=1 Tax=marine sediment metagenome TaxID=412755 RepID=A0A0F9E6K9_9ZZZZ
MGQIVKYEHHGQQVFTDETLKGKHRDYCLCFQCARLDINDPKNNCPIASRLFQICIEENLTTPVFECPKYKPKNGKE